MFSYSNEYKWHCGIVKVKRYNLFIYLLQTYFAWTLACFITYTMAIFGITFFFLSSSNITVTFSTMGEAIIATLARCTFVTLKTFMTITSSTVIVTLHFLRSTYFTVAWLTLKKRRRNQLHKHNLLKIWRLLKAQSDNIQPFITYYNKSKYLKTWNRNFIKLIISTYFAAFSWFISPWILFASFTCYSLC